MTILSNEFGQLACEQLGLDVNKVKSLRIEATAGKKLQVFAELVPDADLENILGNLKKSLGLLSAYRRDGKGFRIEVLDEPIAAVRADSAKRVRWLDAFFVDENGDRTPA